MAEYMYRVFNFDMELMLKGKMFFTNTPTPNFRDGRAIDVSNFKVGLKLKAPLEFPPFGLTLLTQ